MLYRIAILRYIDTYRTSLHASCQLIDGVFDLWYLTMIDLPYQRSTNICA